MKYCPDCDMEFIDSVHTCTDCGRILVDRDKYFEGKALREETERKKAEEERRKAREELEALQAEAEGAAAAAAPLPDPAVYVTRAERYEDLKSSAAAFWIVGGALVVLALSAWAGLLPVNILLKLVFTALAAGSLFIAFKTSQDAKIVRGQIQEESEVTEQLLSWFLENYTGKDVDAAVLRENGELQDEILALKRMNFIQDTFITQYDLADQGYVDALAEEVYSHLFEDEDDIGFEAEPDEMKTSRAAQAGR